MKKLLVLGLAILFVLTMSSGVLAHHHQQPQPPVKEECYGFECTGENVAELFQDGKYNDAFIEQIGQEQYAYVDQEGFDHYADVLQYGTLNVTRVYQKGEGCFWFGGGNTATVEQGADNNYAYINQDGKGNNGEIMQNAGIFH